jgi:uncharacterized membrane protein YgcG
MKTQMVRNSLLVIAAIGTVVFTTGKVAAQDSTAVAKPATATSVAPAAPQLSYGVKQVMKMVQAKVSDTIIVNYIQNTGTIFQLNADEIIYLKQQGMSDTVLNTMLTQRARLTGSTEPATSPAPAPVTQYVQPAAQVAQSGEAYVPATTASMVYVIPSTQSYGYYNSGYPVYPYYTSSYSYWPAVSLAFGYYGGSCYHGGCYHGGYYGHTSYGGNHWGGSSVHVSGFYSGGSHGGSSYGGGIRVGSGWHH